MEKVSKVYKTKHRKFCINCQAIKPIIRDDRLGYCAVCKKILYDFTYKKHGGEKKC